MIVADCTLTLNLLLQTDCHEQARALWNHDSDWLLPTLWQHEFANAMAALTRQDYFESADATQIWLNANQMFFHALYEVDLEQAINLSLQSGLDVYETQYVTLAMQLDLICISDDMSWQHAFPKRVKGLKQYLEDVPKSS